MPRPPPRRTCASSAWNLKQTYFVSSISTAISHMPIRATKTFAAHRILESNLLGLLCLSLPPCRSDFFAQATKTSAFRLFTLKILHFPFMLVYGLANHWVDSQLASGECILSLWSLYMCQLCSLQRTFLSLSLSLAGIQQQNNACRYALAGSMKWLSIECSLRSITFEYFWHIFHSCPSCNASLHNLGFQLG